ncbi:hypothetical protein O9993_08645 [Vibrio lentus]|nr:hypothetical protein [Vibrio lentus]
MLRSTDKRAGGLLGATNVGYDSSYGYARCVRTVIEELLSTGEAICQDAVCAEDRQDFVRRNQGRSRTPGSTSELVSLLQQMVHPAWQHGVWNIST